MTKNWTDHPAFSGVNFDRMAELSRANADFAMRAQHIALKGAADLVSKQTQALKETYDQLSALYTQADWSAGATDISKHQQECAQTALLRAIEHVKLAMDHAGETNKATYELTQDAMKNLTKASKE